MSKLLGLKIENDIRAQKFIQEVLGTQKVYWVHASKGAADSESNDYEDESGNPLPVIPFWSETYVPYARTWWPEGQIQELSLEDFKNLWLAGMDRDNVIVGLNWNQHGIGSERLPLKLLEDLKASA